MNQEITWIKSRSKKPRQFDLVEIKDEFGITQPAWWTGNFWDAGRFKVKGEVQFWKPYSTCEAPLHLCRLKEAR